MSRSHKFHIKRVYEQPTSEDGSRFLVDRLWPRGVRKEALPMTAWLKDVAPSPALRTWFGHKAENFAEFSARYRAELMANPAACEPLLKAVETGDVTLLYAARDPEINHAAILQKFLQSKRNAVRHSG